jgi:pyrimidine operon attenuation protein/uracil phosphoribosyltransferase
MKTQILDHQQVQKILKRMAFQIYEKNFDKKDLIFAAISGQGIEIAKFVKVALEEISKIKIQLLEIQIDKGKPSFNGAEVNFNGIKLNDKTVIMFDDVLNTGRTLIFGMHPFLQHPLRSIQVAVLVDRNHKNFPVSADFIGLSLQTTTQEHVSVTMKSGKVSVYLQ